MAPLFSPNIKIMESNRDINGLIKALSCHDSLMIKDSRNFRMYASQALGNLRAEIAVIPLINSMLQDEVGFVQIAAARALGKIGDAKAIEPLIKFFIEHRDCGVMVAEALGNLGDINTIDTLRKFRYKHPSDKVAGKMCNEAIEKIESKYAEKSKSALDSSQTLEEMIDLYEHDRFVDNKAVIQRIGKLKDKRATKYLCGLIIKGLWVAEIADALGERREKEAIPILLDTLSKNRNKLIINSLINAIEKLDPHLEVSAHNISYFVNKKDWRNCVIIGAPAVVPILDSIKDEFSQDKSWGLIKPYEALRLQAIKPYANTLIEIGKPSVEPLLQILINGEQGIWYRTTCALILGEIGDGRALESLIGVLKDTDMDVRYSSAVALDKFGWLPTNDENGVLYFIAKKDWDSCVSFGSIAIEPLIIAFKDSNIDIRVGAVTTLGKIGNEIVVELLIAALNDKAPSVRIVATKALGQIGDTRAIKPLINNLDLNLNRITGAEGTVNEMTIIIKALGQLNDSRSVQSFNKALNYHITVRIGTGEYEDHGENGPYEVMEDREIGEPVRIAAQEALKKIKNIPE